LGWSVAALLELESLELGLAGCALELEDEESDGFLLRSAEPDIELELDGGVVAPEEEDEAGPDGEAGRLRLVDEEPLEDRSRWALGPLTFRSQP
jgi:hypothetical protein